MIDPVPLVTVTWSPGDAIGARREWWLAWRSFSLRVEANVRAVPMNVTRNAAILPVVASPVNPSVTHAMNRERDCPYLLPSLKCHVACSTRNAGQEHRSERQTMAGTLFFVHGTGVRQEGYGRALELVEAGLLANGLGDLSVVGCQWGDTIGDQFDADWRELVRRTLPPETTPTSGAEVAATDAELETSSWEQLLRDPLMELRLVLLASPPPVAPAPGDDSSLTRDVADVVAEIARRPPSVEGSGLTRDELAAAARTIVASDELTTDGYGSVPATNRGIIRIVAQAVVALALARHRFDAPGTEPRAAVDSAMRDDVVAAIERMLVPGEEPPSVVGGFEGRIRRFVQNRGTAFVRERRLQLMQEYAAPFLADVAFYLRHGETFREYVLAQLGEVEPPVVAVGHSLGGVILVDLLSQDDKARIELLVTAGTQAPLLYALRALEHLTPDDPAATPFTPWLNVYNPNDFLSFCAEPLFPALPGIIDERIEPRGIPFPAAHSAYWMENRLYERIQEVLTANRAAMPASSAAPERSLWDRLIRR
ncbi:MAG TPA: hypothetical protein VGR08_10350 [Thermomicrobiales bacterium]|nr:hypothetical protein [Thermomicrobiales bacterium]